MGSLSWLRSRPDTPTVEFPSSSEPLHYPLPSRVFSGTCFGPLTGASAAPGLHDNISTSAQVTPLAVGTQEPIDHQPWGAHVSLLLLEEDPAYPADPRA